MKTSVSTKDPLAVQNEAQKAYLAMFPEGDRYFVMQAFGWVVDAFTGGRKGYQEIDALYHDLEHTLQGTLCLVRLLRRRHESGAMPALTQKMFELSLLAILLHDTGYLKPSGDLSGTGAKYTYVHVDRSADFANELLREKGYLASEIASVQNMIHCTGLNLRLDAIPFQSELEGIVGRCLGSADLLGQMAAADYAYKLSILFLEFAEAARRDLDNAAFHTQFRSAEQMIRETPGFWENCIKPKLENQFCGVYRYLADKSGRNDYVDRVEANIDRIRRQIAVMPERDLAVV